MLTHTSTIYFIGAVLSCFILFKNYAGVKDLRKPSWLMAMEAESTKEQEMEGWWWMVMELIALMKRNQDSPTRTAPRYPAASTILNCCLWVFYWESSYMLSAHVVMSSEQMMCHQLLSGYKHPKVFTVISADFKHTFLSAAHPTFQPFVN